MSGVSRDVRAEKLLDRLGSRAGLTEPGKQWLMAALDPYHDKPLDVTGFPDGQTGNSVVQVVKQSFNLSAPSGIAGGNANWQAAIVATPWENNIQMNTNASYEIQQGIVSASVNNTVIASKLIIPTGAVTGNGVVGGINIWAAPDGQNFDVYTGVLNTGYTNNNISIDTNYTNENWRIIGKGIEVINTTAEIYKQGLVTTWTQPVDSYETCRNMGIGTYAAPTYTQVTTAEMLPIAAWPRNLAGAINLPDSKQWDAKEGIYMPMRFRDVNIKVQNRNLVQPYLYNNAIMANDTGAPVSGLASIDAPFPQNVQINGVTSTIYDFLAVNWTDFDMSGAYFSGLSPQTTLTVNVIWYVERFPSLRDSNLCVLAKRPPERDHVALELYTHCLRNMPIACPQKYNGLGDWFKDALSTASDYIAPVLSMVPHPAAKGIGLALTAGDHIFNKDKYAQPAAQGVPNAYGDPMTVKKALQNMATKNRNLEVKARNAQIRAKNEAIRAKKAGKKK